MRFVVIVAASIWILVEARSVLVPVAIAGTIWFLTSALARQYRRLLPLDDPLAGRLALLASTATFILAVIILSGMVVENAQHIRANLPVYEANLDHKLDRILTRLGMPSEAGLGQLLREIDLRSIVLQAVGSAAAFLGSAIIIICYVAFIFVEASSFDAKLLRIVPDPERRARIRSALTATRIGAERYLSVTAFIGVIQGGFTWILLWTVGVDAPGFWGLLIFAASFVPTVGTMVGIIFPSLVALVQFEPIAPFLIVVGLLASVQLLCSNWLQPKLMSASLNLSPVAVLLAIFAGGAVWGIIGAFIAVPLLTVAVIGCAQIPEFRPYAIMLSQDGDLPDFGAVDGEDRSQTGVSSS